MKPFFFFVGTVLFSLSASAASEKLIPSKEIDPVEAAKQGKPDRYFIKEESGYGNQNGSNHFHIEDEHEIFGDHLAKPFAGSDFWLCDLALEFLHWPEQKILKTELRKTLSCKVLESINPH